MEDVVRTEGERAALVTRTEIETAVWGATRVAHRSDFDLNPEARPAMPARRPAAVLCPIVERDGDLHVILTRRADHLKRHAGQIAFPGGKVDASDRSPMAAALREAEEEIGLTSALVEMVGAIDDYVTGTGFSVTPFVGFVSPAFRPLIDENEVAEVFETPLAFLMNPANHMRDAYVRNGARREYWAMPHGDRYIWGATAGMLKNLSDRLCETRGALGRETATG